MLAKERLKKMALKFSATLTNYFLRLDLEVLTNTIFKEEA